MARRFRFFARVVGFGVGLGLLAGTALRIGKIDKSEKRILAGSGFNLGKLFGIKADSEIQLIPNKNINFKLRVGAFKPRNELKPLSLRWANSAAQYSDLLASAYMLILDDGTYAKLNPTLPLPAASSIKMPILLVALQLVEQGKIKWNELLELTNDVVAGGAGWMALKPLGTVFPVHDVATEMIRVSDNTATNLLIKRVGGNKFINERFNSLGLKSTRINNWLPDLGGTNITTSIDLALALALVDTNKVLGTRARDLFREVMSTSISNRLLPGGLLKGLGVTEEEPDKNLLIRGFRVYNKTGDIGIAYADAGLIQLPDGRRAVAAFIVKGPFNDPRSTELIRNLVAAMIPSLID